MQWWEHITYSDHDIGSEGGMEMKRGRRGREGREG